MKFILIEVEDDNIPDDAIFVANDFGYTSGSCVPFFEHMHIIFHNLTVNWNHPVHNAVGTDTEPWSNK